LVEASLAAATGAEPPDLDRLFEEETAAVGRDVRMNTRGRDFIRLLHKLLKSSWGRRVSSVNFSQVDEPTLTAWTLASVGPQVFERERLFKDLAVLFGLRT
jgi:aryl carrier-like protein